MARFSPTAAQLAAFRDDGFFVVPNLLSSAEVELLAQIARNDRELMQRSASRGDGEGGAVRLAVENELANNIYAAIVRSERIVRTMEQLLDGEVYHYHHKLILKEPRVGGAWAWHQDYGYWYGNGCLYPLLASCMIAIDPASKTNGCLQVIRGSHHIGRVDHGKLGTGGENEQTGADLERVNKALEKLELVHCELAAGSGIFFHCNLLHRSDQNRSPDPRWAFICCYNAARNSPYKPGRHPQYSPLEVWPDDQILQVGHAQWQAGAAAQSAQAAQQ